jgi:hypothetical protein
MILRDVVLTENGDDTGRMLAHRPSYRPIVTMLGITKPLPPGLPLCRCITEG